MPGHSVERLCAAAGGYDAEFQTRARRWSFLDSHYIPTRYPNGLPDGIPADIFTQEAANGAVALAGEVVDRVGLLLGEGSSQ